jgi:hypothetical protein
MDALAIIEQLDVIKDGCSSFIAGLEILVVNHLIFEV